MLQTVRYQKFIGNWLKKIYENNNGVIPNPLENEEIMQIGKRVKERIRSSKN